MGRTFIRQDAQVGSTQDSIIGFNDGVTPGATMESGASTIADDLNNLRSILSLLKDVQAGNWYDDLATPGTFTGEGEAQRGVDDLNLDLHVLARKRFLRRDVQLVDITVGAGDNFAILGGGELPANTTIAVGAVQTRGTVAAAHGGTFGNHALDEVGGPTAIGPDNLVRVVDGSSRDELASSSRTIYALLQSENAADGHTATATTPNRLQVSFVRLNATGDDLEAVPVSDIENQTVNLTFTERIAFEDLNEADLLNDSKVDVPSSATVTRQVAYDNQGATPVDQTTNAVLDLEGAGLEWQIRDDLEAILFRIVEGSAGGTSEVEISAATDVFDVDAPDVDFDAGISVATGKTRPIDVGENDGVIESTAGDLRLLAAAELFLDDVNQATSTWAQTDGIKLSDTPTEWDTFETNFGEVSLLNAINQAFANDQRTKVQAVLTANVSADTDVNGPGTPHSNTDVDLAPFDQVTFVDDVEVYLNGELLRNAANDGGGEDVYPGGTPADGDLAFQFQLKGTGSKPDQLTVIVNGQ